MTLLAPAVSLLFLLAAPPAAPAAGAETTVKNPLLAPWTGPYAGVPQAEAAFRLVAATTALSILLHSSTDVPVVRWLTRPERTATA